MKWRAVLSYTGTAVAALLGVVAGLTLALATDPARVFAGTFRFSQIGIVSWRGMGDTIPTLVEVTGWSGPMYYTTPEAGAVPEGAAGRLPTGVWAPGDAVSRHLVVRNADPDYVMRIEGLRVGIRGDLGLAPWFQISVTGAGGQVLYQGRLSDFTAGTLPLQEPLVLPLGSEQTMEFAVMLDRNTDQAYQGKTVVADFTLEARSFTTPMIIDIHPNSWPNPIRPGSSGSIPVAMNGSTTLDVTSLDWRTARFGPNRIAPLSNPGFEDWNKDGFTDLILHFSNPESGIACGVTEVRMTIFNGQGVQYEGADAIITPGCH